MKKALVLSYFFPPFSDSGVFRITKFVKYMRDFGWDPVIVSASNPYALNEDTSLLKDVPEDVALYRVPGIAPMGLFRKARASFSHEKNSEGTRKLKMGLVLRKLFRKMFFDLLTPDFAVTWSPSAYWMGKKVCCREAVDIIFVTDPPSSYLAGKALSRKYKIPLVVEFRDSWTLRRYGVQPKSSVRVRIENHLERAVLAMASRVVFIGPLMKKRYSEKYPEYATRFRVIPNGYDEDDFQARSTISPAERGPACTLLHAGRLSEFRSPLFLFRAIREMLDEERTDEDRLKVRFVGDFSLLHKDAVLSLQLDKIVNIFPYMPHGEITREMEGSDILLLIGGDDAEIVTGKLFEYMAANRPILALVSPEGEVARIIREAHAGIVVPHDDVRQIKKALLDMCGNPDYGSAWSNDRQKVSFFSRKLLTQKLCGIFEEALS